jgi:MacB-like periplasmic core domain
MPVAVISYGLWQRRYGGSPDVLGRKISINDSPCEVVGVMPRDFFFLPGRDIDIWMSASFPAWMLRSFGWRDAQVVARLKPGVTLEHARNRWGHQACRSLPLFRYRDFDRRVAYVHEVLQKIRAIPGVVDAGATFQVPLKPNDATATFYSFAGQSTRDAIRQVALIRGVSRDYFRTIGAQLREGRFFETSDQCSESAVAVVNESFANRNFRGRPAIGARFQFGQFGGKAHWYTIVGVVKEIREVGMGEELRPVVYRVHEQTDQVPIEVGCIVIRTSVKPDSIVSAARQAIWSIDKNQPIWHIRTLDEILDRQLSTPSQSTALLSAFGLLALLLTCIGLYGVLSYAVMQRTNEIGVRMALGATANRILLSFGQRGLVLTLAGLAIGLVLTSIASRLMTITALWLAARLFPNHYRGIRHSPGGCRSRVFCSRASCVAHRSRGFSPQRIATGENGWRKRSHLLHFPGTGSGRTIHQRRTRGNDATIESREWLAEQV